MSMAQRCPGFATLVFKNENIFYSFILHQTLRSVLVGAENMKDVLKVEIGQFHIVFWRFNHYFLGAVGFGVIKRDGRKFILHYSHAPMFSAAHSQKRVFDSKGFIAKRTIFA